MTKQKITEIPNCLTCKRLIKIQRARDYAKKYCDWQCAGARNLRPNKLCKTCRLSFHPKYTSQIFCSNKCRGENQKSTYTKQCQTCGKTFMLNNRAQEKRGRGQFCSISCKARKYFVDEHYFDTIDSPEKAYWLGFLFADGYQNGKEMVINLAPKDKEHLVKLRTALSSEHPIKEARRVTYRVGSALLCKALNAHGCVQAKSLILAPPIGLEEDFLSDFIRGYFDGDGHVKLPSANGAGCSMHCAGIEFRTWLVEKLNEQGIAARTTNSQQGRNIVVTNLREVQKFYAFIYQHAGPYLERKHERFLGQLTKSKTLN